MGENTGCARLQELRAKVDEVHPDTCLFIRLAWASLESRPESRQKALWISSSGSAFPMTPSEVPAPGEQEAQS